MIGVSLIHAKHVLHRDIKTENIFITKSNELKIGDFGVSKQIDTLGLAKTLIGTLYSLSPGFQYISFFFHIDCACLYNCS